MNRRSYNYGSLTTLNKRVSQRRQFLSHQKNQKNNKIVFQNKVNRLQALNNDNKAKNNKRKKSKDQQNYPLKNCEKRQLRLRIPLRADCCNKQLSISPLKKESMGILKIQIPILKKKSKSIFKLNQKELIIPSQKNKKLKIQKKIKKNKRNKININKSQIKRVFPISKLQTRSQKKTNKFLNMQTKIKPQKIIKKAQKIIVNTKSKKIAKKFQINIKTTKNNRKEKKIILQDSSSNQEQKNQMQLEDYKQHQEQYLSQSLSESNIQEQQQYNNNRDEDQSYLVEKKPFKNKKKYKFHFKKRLQSYQSQQQQVQQQEQVQQQVQISYRNESQNYLTQNYEKQLIQSNKHYKKNLKKQKKRFELRQRTLKFGIFTFKKDCDMNNSLLQNFDQIPKSNYQRWDLQKITINHPEYKRLQFIDQITVQIMKIKKTLMKNILPSFIHINFPKLTKLDLRNNNQATIQILQVLNFPNLKTIQLSHNMLISIRSLRKIQNKEIVQISLGQYCQLIHDAQVMNQLWAPSLKKLIYKPKTYRFKAPYPYQHNFGDFYREFFKLEANLKYYVKDFYGTYKYFVQYLKNQQINIIN